MLFLYKNTIQEKVITLHLLLDENNIMRKGKRTRIILCLVNVIEAISLKKTLTINLLHGFYC